MPVIVSDQLPYYQTIYINTFPDWNDFALVVPEDIFLADPVGSLDAAVDDLMQSKLVLERKIEGLRLLQRKSVSFKGLPVGGSDNSGNSGGRTSLLKRRSSKQAMAATPMEDGIHPQLWGRPGHLTDAEADVYEDQI
ncbi:hypothetical protein FRACYDRAFT_250754 [Fragilariopsis cylindrus CCMP1102]|uniref:Uncharacterized protein n=1 Tax=Fragilariopsis cylindrus CCMP1102 TaxID=635003 RepID=A0A1E7EP50_9STRA|nr:hypothetical protein FRACYDRAFT_250754 [Fragilariopsis cylindrus CCMP1102]|eukprot:OEU07730.1 hypothetical protein FRACYDRAFT_250754 [Fragilariopsis cylindrus CCMP1102]